MRTFLHIWSTILSMCTRQGHLQKVLLHHVHHHHPIWPVSIAYDQVDGTSGFLKGIQHTNGIVCFIVGQIPCMIDLQAYLSGVIKIRPVQTLNLCLSGVQHKLPLKNVGGFSLSPGTADTPLKLAGWVPEGKGAPGFVGIWDVASLDKSQDAPAPVARRSFFRVRISLVSTYQHTMMLPQSLWK